MATPTIGASQHGQSCPTAQPSTINAWPVPRGHQARHAEVARCVASRPRYSCRRVRLGSTLAAAREGIQQARNATAPKNTGTMMKVAPS
jgi:hypothetical protein